MAPAMDSQRPQLAQTRPKSKSGFSFRSDKSLQETAADKRVISGKANPNAAMNEVEPVAAALEKPTIASLRSISYNDSYGNLITDPDRSNPTRPRFERPLDTIKAFEAAIEKEYKMRSGQEAPTEVSQNNNGYSSRRSSSYWGGGYDQARPEARQRHSSYGQQQYGREGYGYPRQQRPGPAGPYGSRNPSDPALNRYNSAGPSYSQNNSQNNSQRNSPVLGGGPVRQPSRDNIPDSHSAGSGSERWTNNTDPSDNSSVERMRGVQTPNEAYTNETANFGGPIMEDEPYHQNSRNGSNYFAPPANTYNYGQAPAPPPKVEPRKMISLSSPQNAYNPSLGNSHPGDSPPMGGPVRPTMQAQPEEKRKSWFRRRLSSRAT